MTAREQIDFIREKVITRKKYDDELKEVIFNLYTKIAGTFFTDKVSKVKCLTNIDTIHLRFQYSLSISDRTEILKLLNEIRILI